MRSSGFKSIAIPVLIIIAGFAAIVSLSGYLERHHPQLPPDYEDSDLSMNGSKLKGFALGFEGLMADWYWMRSLQYIGGKIDKSESDINIDDMRSLNPKLLYPYLENATDLDPHFIAAYSYGAMVLPAIDAQKAIELTNRGIANNPSEWRLYQHLGYIYWKMGKYDKSAESYETGSRIDGAAPFMRMMAASMQTSGGSRSTAREIYRQMLTGADDEQVKLTATRRLYELASLDEREAIDKVLADFQTKNGRCAASFGEIITLLMPVKLPDGRVFSIDSSGRIVDPTGAPYLLDKQSCRSQLDRAKTGIAIQ